MPVQNMPVNLYNPDTGAPYINYSAQMNTQNYAQPLDMTALRQAASMPIMNAKQAGNTALTDSLPMLRNAYGMTSKAGLDMAMPMLQKLAQGNVDAAEQQANIQNEEMKRQTMVNLMDMAGKQENAKNFGIVESALQALTGAKIDPTYAQLSFVSPTTEMQTAMGLITKQAELDNQKAARDQQRELTMAGINAANDRSAMSAASRGGSGGSGGSGMTINPNDDYSGIHTLRSTLQKIVDDTDMTDEAKLQELANYSAMELKPLMMKSPTAAQNAIGMLRAAGNNIYYGKGDEWYANLMQGMAARKQQQEEE